MQKVIISILHYNSNRDTIACLLSLSRADFKNIEVITYVLDNASKEELSSDSGACKEINLNILKVSTNLGFTGGHNYIYEKIKDEKFDYFLLLNNDSIVEKDFLKNLIEGFEDPGVGIAVPKIYFTKGREFHRNRYKKEELGKVFWYAGGHIDWQNVMSVHRGVDDVDSGQFDRKERVTFATGACLLIKKEVLSEIGLFDRRYFLYYEDADFNVRAQKKGYFIMYVPQSIVWHNNSGSSGSGSELHDYYLTRNRLLFGVKFAPFKTKQALIKEGLRLLVTGRKWQKNGVRDYFLKKFGKGSF